MVGTQSGANVAQTPRFFLAGGRVGENFRRNFDLVGGFGRLVKLFWAHFSDFDCPITFSQ